jgi:hypothetical protein
MVADSDIRCYGGITGDAKAVDGYSSAKGDTSGAGKFSSANSNV